jgi:hypothetical protein
MDFDKINELTTDLKILEDDEMLFHRIEQKRDILALK